MPLQWTVSRPTRLVIAVAKDELRLKDIENYLDEILAAGNQFTPTMDKAIKTTSHQTMAPSR